MAMPLADKPQFPPSLKTMSVQPDTLIRVSGHNTNEPYFGKLNAGRFDDPNPDVTARYGTCYAGMSLAVGVAETLLRDRTPVQGYYVVELAVIMQRYVIQFTGQPLVLADLTGAELKRIGGHAELTGTSTYDIPKQWSVALHAHPDNVDGFVYMSRHKNDEKAVLLFDRAAPKLQMTTATPLHLHPDFGQVATELYIRSSAP
jgi:hypothetical protein